jgi:purine nucleosidase/adenosylhomocysteine nucleosidase
VDVLVVVATEAEAQYVPDELPVLITGVGKVSAAVAVAEALAERSASSTSLRVVNIGTAGALRDGLTGTYTPATVINHDLSAELIRAVGIPATDQLDVAGTHDIVLATGDSFVADLERRSVLAERASLVDMEGFAVAWACSRRGVSCTLVKHVSDNADDGALSWSDVVDHSAAELGRWLADNVVALSASTRDREHE